MGIWARGQREIWARGRVKVKKKDFRTRESQDRGARTEEDEREMNGNQTDCRL